MPRVLANGIHLHYAEAGRGDPPLLLLHGVGGSHEMWLPLMPSFAGSRRVLAGDHRGHGGSDKPAGPYTTTLMADDWLAALDALGIARADVLGLSLGGAIAMRLAASHPSRVRRLVLLDTWGRPDRAFVALMRDREALLARGDLAAYAELSISQVFTAEYIRTHPGEMDAYRARVAQAEVASLTAAVRACIAHDMGTALRRITTPTLVVVGALDHLTPRASAELLAAEIPDARLVVIDDAAHFPHVERAEEFLRVVKPFLDGDRP
jgi:3-oxoadipate enol-lactonase